MKMVSKRSEAILDSDETRKLARFLVGNSPIDNPDQLVELALSLSLGPLYLHHLKQTNSVINDSVLTRRLEAETKSSVFLHLVQEQAMLEVNQALTNAGIRCVWLKGATLGHMIYPEPYLRTKSDLDCIVYEGDFDEALEILLKMGYLYFDNPEIKTVAHERLWHHVQLKHKVHRGVRLELHRHLLGWSGPHLIKLEHLVNWINQAVRVNIIDQEVCTLRHEHHLLYLCAHTFLQHGENEIGLRELLDILWMLTTSEIDQNLLIEEANMLGWTNVTRYAINRIQDYFDTIIPDDLTLKIQRQPGIIKSYSPYDHQQYIAGVPHLNMLSMRERIVVAFQLLFPPSEYMRERYNIPHHRHVIPYYVRRMLHQLKEAFKELISYFRTFA